MRRTTDLIITCLLVAGITLASAGISAQPQPGGKPGGGPGGKPPEQHEEDFKNLKVFDKKIPKDQLIDIMKAYTGSLGVRCDFCHLESADHRETDFASDSLPAKQVAREMILMTNAINGTYLPKATGESAAEMAGTVTCMTCHRGSKEPVFIEDIMMRAHKAGGADSVKKAYQNLRDIWYGRAKFDFGAPPMTNFTAMLFDTDTSGAMALQRMNIDYNPKSVEGLMVYAQMLLERHDSTTALYFIDSSLAINPQHRGALHLKEALTSMGVTKSTAPKN